MNNDIVIEYFKKDGQVVNVIKAGAGGDNSLPYLLAYLEENRASLYKTLLKDGAILFRGFDISERESFLQVKEVIAGAASFSYVDGNSPRTKVAANIYTSTEYPQEYRITLHSEMSYSNKWPEIIFFFCKTPAAEGGETPIVDCRHILKKLDAAMVDKFEQHGVKYTRYLNGTVGLGKTWMDTFETKDKAVVEAYCRESGIEYTWYGDALYLSQQGTGVATHPVTGEKVWFNQANQFHPSNLPNEIYRGLQLMHAKNKHRYPQYAFYGNNEEIDLQHLNDITEAHFEHAIIFKWEKGDVLVLDNMLMAHGRMPFAGDRKIYVSMC